MAATNLKITKVNDFNVPAVTPEGLSVGHEGMDIDFSGRDCDILISVTVSPVTIKAGNGIAGCFDLEVPAGRSVVLDSGCFKNVTGPHKGCVYLVGEGAKVTAIQLP